MSVIEFIKFLSEGYDTNEKRWIAFFVIGSLSFLVFLDIYAIYKVIQAIRSL